ncbi:hypothetical protein CVT26_014791 [Gymnopilus dilepis]|uniref:Cation/H+ exchanger transmembrane domain-containing protein n=1 Tax=Gymnopilus dilepis TaxID=231916 RepID=A0A409W9R3_9AGAR|nr:hypothetical protein CVT26_014791 [Gymnopilus dilepis]
MGEFSHQVLSLFSRAATEQGGVISGDNPSVYNTSDPFQLWVIQLIIIVAMTQFLSIFLSRLRQPRVIAEVVAGVVLGPTAMGRIPGFTQAIFPEASLPVLSLTSTIGLILYLFLVGLEIDTRLMRKNIMSSVSVSVAGLVVPLGLGAALGVGLYREFMSPTVNIGYFLLFVAVAVGITAFPVLCRILTELKLLDTEVGLVTLSAGIGNDVVGWILLALTVALVNASSGLTALWVLLASAGYAVFLLYPGRWAIRWLARRTGSLEQGSPTVFMMTIILFTIFVSAFFTDIIGVHPIFGGFLAGLVVPHDNGFAISIVEKLEDLISITFLPLYFTLSGLKTNLALLNTGIIWGYVVLICVVAFSSKFLACAGAARFSGYGWRESGAVGALMSCKGLVELIALNIGLQANILTTQTFSMFVVHALILTFVTTPLVLVLYPSKYRVHFKTGKGHEEDPPSTTASSYGRRVRFAMVLDKAEALPPAMTLSQLLHTPDFATRSSMLSSIDEKIVERDDESVSVASAVPGVKIEALRLMELTSRTSAMLRSQEASALIYNDPITSVYTTFGRLNNFKVSVDLSVVSFDEFPETIANFASDTNTQMVIIPWPRGPVTVTEEEGHDHGSHSATRNPFDPVFHKASSQDQTKSVVYSEYIRRVFSSCPTDVALFVDRGIVGSYVEATRQHLFLPFFGGPDDRLALAFLVQLCERPSVTATVVKVTTTDGLNLVSSTREASTTLRSSVTSVDTIYGHQTTQTRIASETADNILWDRYTRPNQHHPIHIASALSRITFRNESTPTPLRRVVEMVKTEATLSQPNSYLSKTFIVLLGRSRRMAVESLTVELRSMASIGSSMSTSVPRTLGDVGAALVAAGVNASLLVFQASSSLHV